MHDSTYEDRKAALIGEIIAAFDGVERGSGVTLHEAYVIDNYGSSEERALARLKDQETCWQNVPEKDICCGYEVLNFLDGEGFRYYIPAYMMWYLHHIDDEETDSNTFEFVDYSLAGFYDREHAQQEWFPLLSHKQKMAIAHFMFLMAERDESINAELGMADWPNTLRSGLDRFWGQFL